MVLTLSALTREAAVLYMSIEHCETLERIHWAEVVGDLEISYERERWLRPLGMKPEHVSNLSSFHQQSGVSRLMFGKIGSQPSNLVTRGTFWAWPNHMMWYSFTRMVIRPCNPKFVSLKMFTCFEIFLFQFLDKFESSMTIFFTK